MSRERPPPIEISEVVADAVTAASSQEGYSAIEEPPPEKSLLADASAAPTVETSTKPIGLPLFAAATPLSATSWERAGDLQVLGGVQGTDWKYTSGNVVVNGADYGTSNVVEVLSSTPLTIKNASGKATSATTIQINAGVKADLTLAGVNIVSATAAPINMITNSDEAGDGVKIRNAADIQNKTTLYLTLADGTDNTLENTKRTENGWPAIRCGWGSILVIDDSVTNVKAGGSKFNLDDIVTPAKGVVPYDITLMGGKSLKAGEPLEAMESANPGTLLAKGGAQSAGIGSAVKENAGTLIFNGGDIDARTLQFIGYYNETSAAAIGSAPGGSGTIITINGGNVSVTGGSCGSGIGCGMAAFYNSGHTSGADKPDAINVPQDGTDTYAYGYSWFGPVAHLGLNTQYPDLPQYQSVAGDITINGGFTKITAPVHGNALGQSCQHGVANNLNHLIRITGGTLLTSVPGKDSVNPLMFSIGATYGYTLISGGSVLVENRPGTTTPMFQGLGDTAYNTSGVESWDDVVRVAGGQPNDDLSAYHLPDNDKVFMITIDLKAEIEKRNAEAGITSDPNFDDRIRSWKLLVGGVEVDYGSPDRFNNGELYLWLPKTAMEKEITVDLSYTDKNGNEQKIEPLFRDPSTAELGGNTLKRYVKFELPDNMQTTKYYDGEPLQGLSIGEGASIPAIDGKELNDGAFVRYKYQLHDAINGSPIGAESASSTNMPTDAGIMKVTVDSAQYSKGDPDNFGKSYWGHRATGWFEIKPTTSKIDLVSAKWEDDQPGSVMETAKQRLTVSADIKAGDNDPEGAPNGPKCQAPRGYVQIYVDKKPVGDPVKLVFAGDTDNNGAKIAAGDPRINAEAVKVGEGSYTAFTYSFVPAENDFLVPDAKGDNTHEVAVRYLPPSAKEDIPANYLESLNPAENPEAPKAEVVIEPVDPKTEVTGEPDPEAPEEAPDPEFKLDPDPKPTVPEDHPTGDPIYPGDKTYKGSLVTVYDVPTADNPHPGRVILKVKSESSGAISLEGTEGNPFTVDFVRGADGAPVRDADGTYTLILDPTAVGKGLFHIVQAPNGAFTGTHWDIDVTVKPNPKIAPEPALTKTVENLTHPEGPTQPHDKLRYTITASNKKPGSLWSDVVISDPLPQCLELDRSTLKLTNGDGAQIDLAPAMGTTPDEGHYALSAPDPEGRRTLRVSAGDIAGDKSAVLTFECTVALDSFQGALAADLDLANTARATGTRPDPSDPDKPMPDPNDPSNPLPVDPDPAGPVTPPGPGSVVPNDPSEADLEAKKSVVNISRSDGTTHVGDRLRYEISVANGGPATSVLWNAVIADPLPRGIEPVSGTLKLIAPDGSEITVADGAYHKATRTIAVSAGDLWGGQSATLSFECIVGKEAMGANNSNIGYLFGTPPSDTPEKDPTGPGQEPGVPEEPPAGTPASATEPTDPPTVIPDDPDPESISIAKGVANVSRDDGTTHVGDRLHYTIKLANDEVGTGWIDAVIRDDVPEGLEPISGTIKLTLADGRELTVDDRAYNPKTRILAVSCGRLYGGQAATLTFDALVTEEALGADIGNLAMGYGTLPSKWDPDAPETEPGLPFDPPGGWKAWESSHEKVVSQKVFPPGVTEAGGVLAGDQDKESAAKQMDSTVKHKLAKTGDTETALAGVSALAALVSGAIALIARRRSQRA